MICNIVRLIFAHKADGFMAWAELMQFRDQQYRYSAKSVSNINGFGAVREQHESAARSILGPID